MFLTLPEVIMTYLVGAVTGYMIGYVRARRNSRLLVRGQFDKDAERRTFDN